MTFVKSSFADGRDVPEDVLDSFIVSLEFVYRELVVLETTSTVDSASKQSSRHCLSTLISIQAQQVVFGADSFYVVQPVLTGAVGRPSFDVSPYQLSFVIENRFSVLQIADMIGVSIRTIRRRMSKFGLSITAH